MTPIEIAIALIGTPFEWHGRSRAGLDCLGLILLPLIEAGRIPSSFDFRDYGNHPQNLLPELRGRGAAYLREIEAPKVGGIVVYQIGSISAHLAWIESETTIIHAHQREGVIRDYRQDWAKRERFYFEVV